MTISKDDEREAREWLSAATATYSGNEAAKHRATILALLDAPRLPRPEDVPDDVFHDMAAASRAETDEGAPPSAVMREAYRALYDHYTAPPQPKKVEAWAAYHCSGRKCLSFSEEDARSFAGFNGRIVKLTEDRDGE